MDRSNAQPIYGYYGYLHILVNASIKWWPIDRSIKCAAQSIKRADPSNARDIYIIYVTRSRWIRTIYRLARTIDGSINRPPFDRCFTRMGKYPSIGCQLIDPYITQHNLSIAHIHQMRVTCIYIYMRQNGHDDP